MNIANCRLPIANSQLPVAGCELPIANSRFRFDGPGGAIPFRRPQRRDSTAA